MKVVKDVKGKQETLFTGSENKCYKYVYNMLATQNLKCLVLTDSKNRSLYAVSEPSEFVIRFKD